MYTIEKQIVDRFVYTGKSVKSRATVYLYTMYTIFSIEYKNREYIYILPSIPPTYIYIWKKIVDS